MTNYEYYKNEIDRIVRMGRFVAIDKNTREIDVCCIIPCERCLFNNTTKSCQIKAVEWGESEYEEPTIDWSTVAIDTPILVRDTEKTEWYKRYFAGLDEKGRVIGWDDGRTSWSVADPSCKICWEYAKLAEVEE